ncbi:topoisomerase II [Hibiscus trionum]|uniref:DNA topoisomerase (ATP-hydrolyzing) n=1 Tax=Hibiscus trionum TaxID=183268 RepID=A0A9W7M375_HIBTR|nr:topoisomerase II [Hibiscus trionum]
MTELDNDLVVLIKKSVFNLAACLEAAVDVKLNGESLVNSFVDYVKYYLKDVFEPLLSFHTERWEVCVSLSEGQFQHTDFVNGISTTKGGTHVDYVTGRISKYVLKSINKQE